MSDRVAFLEGRSLPRLALTGLALIWLAGCSQDVARFNSSGNPFSNPFASQTAQATPAAVGAFDPCGFGAARAADQRGERAAARADLRRASRGAGSRLARRLERRRRHAGRGRERRDARTRFRVATGCRRPRCSARTAFRARPRSRAACAWSFPSTAPATAPWPPRKSPPTAAEKTKKHAEDVAANDKRETSGKARKAEDKAAEKTKAEDSEGGQQKSKREVASKTKAEKVAKSDAGKSETSKSDVAKTDSKTKPDGKTQVAKTDAAKATAGKKPGVDDDADRQRRSEGGRGQGARHLARKPTPRGPIPEFRWPARGRIIQGFKAGGNDGIDISVPAGTSVRAAESGVVVYSGDGLKGYGNLVLIKHPNGYVTAYANNAELDVKRGEQVKRGQVIAKSGDTGNVNSPQLHFELRKGSTPVDPTSYLAGL